LGAGVTAVSFAVGAFVRRFARPLRLIDVPNERSSHDIPTPRGGGLGIVIAVAGGLLAASGLGLELPAAALPVVLIAGVTVASVSFVDDLRGVPATVRLLVHFSAGALVLFVAGAEPVLAIGREIRIDLGWMLVPIALVWIAGMTNAYNFMDGVDGLAGGQAVAASAVWAGAGWWLGRPDLVTMGVVIGAAAAGFLIHNWSPAKLFMGDVGSAFLGFTLAAIPLMAEPPREALALPAVLALWPFVFDTAFTLVRRASRRENLLAAHRSHLYQRLTIAGWRQPAACLLFLALAAAGGGAAFLLLVNVRGAELVAAGYLVGSAGLVVALVSAAERRTRTEAEVP
jgi:Fuc2NAc and GlcNAc transferase